MLAVIRRAVNRSLLYNWVRKLPMILREILSTIKSNFKNKFVEIDQVVAEKEFWNMRKKAASLAWTHWPLSVGQLLLSANVIYKFKLLCNRIEPWSVSDYCKQLACREDKM